MATGLAEPWVLEERERGQTEGHRLVVVAAGGVIQADAARRALDKAHRPQLVEQVPYTRGPKLPTDLAALP